MNLMAFGRGEKQTNATALNVHIYYKKILIS